MSQPNPPALRELLESLPKELYDEIDALTFTPSGRVVKISANFKAQVPDINLQVNRATRASYVGSITFVGTQWQMIPCVEKMPPPLRAQLKDVRTLQHKGEPRAAAYYCYAQKQYRCMADKLNHGVWKSFMFESEIMASLGEKE